VRLADAGDRGRASPDVRLLLGVILGNNIFTAG